ncbi:12852_t:CDS:1, partial [Gigaspora rosea]
GNRYGERSCESFDSDTSEKVKRQYYRPRSCYDVDTWDIWLDLARCKHYLWIKKREGSEQA